MGRGRKTDRHMPRRMYYRHGAHWYVDQAGKWHRLHEDYTASLKRYAAMIESAAAPFGTVKAVIERYTREVLSRKSEDSRKNRAKEFKQLMPVFGHVDAADVKPSDVWKYLADRGSNRAALGEVKALSAAFSHGVKIGALNTNVLIGPRWGEGIAKPRDRYVTDEEFLRVREVAPAMIRYAMNIALITAARQKDILSLTRSQVAQGLLSLIISKGRKPISFAYTGSLKENIDAALREAPQIRQFVICTRHGKRYTRDGFQTMWQRAMIEAFPDKAQRFHFHDIRAKSLSDAKTLEEARERAGHEDSRITERVYRRKGTVATVHEIGFLDKTKILLDK